MCKYHIWYTYRRVTERETHPFHNQLSNAIPLLNREINLGEVKQQHLDFTAVVSVDDARARVNEVLRREAAAGGDAAVCLIELVSPLDILQYFHI